MLPFLIIMPLFAAALGLAISDRRLRGQVLILATLGHFILTLRLWMSPVPSAWQGFLSVDALGLLTLSCVSVLFVAVAFYLPGYLDGHKTLAKRFFESGLLMLLAAMSLVTLSRDMGLLWIALEATTLFSALLVNAERNPRSIEATWKFLLICSVGIAMALLGTFFLAMAAVHIKTMFLDELISRASLLSLPWLKLSVIFLLVGYGTKMGLAPLHSWKPDIYGEAPAPVVALMAGALTSCVFLIILRVGQICFAAGQGPFFQSIMLLLGVLSLCVAAVFILDQQDLQRMLGYSSVEHMGILALGVGVGGLGFYASIFHMINNALAKGLIFCVAGMIVQRYGTKKISEIRGACRHHPVLGVLLLLAFFAVCGLPPFGTFLSEMMVLYASIANGHYFVAGVYVLCLAVIFIGMARAFVHMAQGGAHQDLGVQSSSKEDWRMIMPMVVLVVLIAGLGVYMPPVLDHVLQEAVALLGAGK